ncbi:MAG: glycerophosphodiester phosphodiesterase [Nocardioidaceae bacterium]
MSKKWNSAVKRILGALAVATFAITGFAAPARAATTPKGCVLIAHRGDHATYTENSIGAMRQAVADRAGDLETDIHASADDHLFVMHDDTVDRTSDGTGPIADKTAAQLRALRLDDGERIPYFTGVLKVAVSSGTPILVEVKSVKDAETYAHIVSAVDSVGAQRLVTFASFHGTYLDRLRAIAPAIRQAIISNTALPASTVQHFGGIEVSYQAVTDAWLSSLGDVPVYAWTPDTEAKWSALMGRVTGVITNNDDGFRAYEAEGCPAS